MKVNTACRYAIHLNVCNSLSLMSTTFLTNDGSHAYNLTIFTPSKISFIILILSSLFFMLDICNFFSFFAITVSTGIVITIKANPANEDGPKYCQRKYWHKMIIKGLDHIWLIFPVKSINLWVSMDIKFIVSPTILRYYKLSLKNAKNGKDFLCTYGISYCIKVPERFFFSWLESFKDFW